MTDITQTIRDALAAGPTGANWDNIRLDRTDITAVLARLDAAELDAARYRWLRHGDNDEKIIAYADDADKFSWLPRNKELDDAIDAAMKGNL